ncbi:MAG: alpha-amylase family glycosyl hydrolase, partial [Luteolibacter sp.]
MKPILLRALLALLLVVNPVQGEAMLQYFNTSWAEIADKMPELAEAGYDSLWVPPPTKGSGGLSVGYDLWDRFDLGSKDQRNTVSTRYGTEDDLLRLMEIAHRFGIRIYFDTIMNHNAFDIPGYDAGTPIDIYPGMVPEDFHLKLTSEGFYRKWDNTRNWGDAWQVQHLGLADLIDIAQEPGTTNENFGTAEGNTFPKIKFVRQPNNPEYYCYLPNGTYVGFGPNNGITTAILTDPANVNVYSERVEDFLNRAARWLIDRTKADGMRLDAVKHVRADFFGATYGANKDSDDYGFGGQVQRQFNLSRGFSDPNHRDTLFDTEKPRDDAMLFGEHLGEPPGYGDYLDAGMRLVDNPLRQNLNDKLGNPSSGLQGYDQPGAGGFSPETGVMHAQSHDNDYAARPELQQAFYYTRAGLGLLYTDGNNQAETLGESGGAFPRHANTNFLGQYNDPRVPNLLYIHNQFARGYQKGLQPYQSNNNPQDPDYVAYERIDKRENPSMSDADGVTLLFLLNDNYANGLARSVNTSFPATAFGNNAYLYNYSSYGGGFYKYASELNTVVVPPGGYFAFSWKNPDPSNLWANGGGKPITILQNNGQPVSSLTYDRKDGRDGDNAFNPYNLPDTDTTDYKYSITVPRVTNGTALSFIARADGSAENILMELDGGVDINSQIPLGPTTGDRRDNAPGFATDTFLGYEQMQFDHRQGAEKFAAINTARCIFGSAGAETYTAGSATVNGFGSNPQDADAATFVYHDPTAGFSGWSGTTDTTQYVDNGSSITIWAKTNSVGLGFRMFIYYTTDGSNPEGAGGVGNGSTTVESFYFSPNTSGGDNWWRGQITPKPSGTLKYKIGIYKETSNGFPISSLLPSGATEASRKKNMMTVFKVPTFNATTAPYKPHNDYGATVTGLSEGFHFLRARAFLKRPGQASIYNTFTQTFYYDAQTPQGEIKFPATDGSTLSGQTYGVVVRADQSVKDVWVHIDDTDSDPSNDDIVTHVANGNGIGFEPFVDSNNNGTWDTGETFTDLNGNGVWDNNVPAWIKVSEGTASASVNSIYPREWRFDYRNIAASGAGAIKVRLREISSSAKLFEVGNSDISDATGHFTTLTRTFNAAGDPQRMYVAYPSTDGQTVGEGYVMKVRFSSNLADGTNEETLKSRFVIKIASSESGSLANPVTQSTASYQIIYNSSPGYHDLAFTIPNLYNGVTDFIHTIQVSLTRPLNSALITSRQVRAYPTAQGTFVNIKSPPEFDSDGKRYEIILPDVANPTPEQRQTQIAVETSTDITSTNITFAGNAGTATLTASTETALRAFVSVTNGSASVAGVQKQLTGTASTVAASSTITGVGTAFTTELAVGAIINVGSETFTVLTLNSATTLTVTTTATIPASGVPVFLQPQFDQNLSVGNTIKIGGTSYTVSSINSASSITLNSNYIGATASNLTAYRVDPNPVVAGTKKNWTFLWTNMTPGYFTFTATAQPSSGSAVSANRNATVVFRQVVASDPNDADDDDDGLGDINETTTTALPTTNAETWTNGQVHVYYAYGHTNPLSPDTDGDGLPDGLEVGWRTATNPPTDPLADTNGDGVKNFVGDLDPPFFNTLGTDYVGQTPSSNYGRVPGVNSSSEGGDRAALKGGSTTNPNDPDTDHDGIMDGVEDANKNGWVDGDGEILPTNFLPYLGRKWPNGKMDPNEVWTETDPNIADTDGDGLLDGYGEDKNGNGFIDGDTNKNRAYDSGEMWTETNPINADTDGDGLPDGWEVNNGLDPLDNGTLSMRTGGAGNPVNGANGNPDGDTILVDGQQVPYTNILELKNGTDPQTPNTIAPPPPGSIIIGPQSSVVVGGVTNIREFTDWSLNDLMVLDEYDGGGTNNQGGDIYHANDGYDSSRDLTAFYAHDGGNTTVGGDGNFYFRVDLEDLLPNAEAGNLDIYVVIDSGSPAV